MYNTQAYIVGALLIFVSAMLSFLQVFCRPAWLTTSPKTNRYKHL
jgi:hypothetical protein